MTKVQLVVKRKLQGHLPESVKSFNSDFTLSETRFQGRSSVAQHDTTGVRTTENNRNAQSLHKHDASKARLYHQAHSRSECD